MSAAEATTLEQLHAVQWAAEELMLKGMPSKALALLQSHERSEFARTKPHFQMQLAQLYSSAAKHAVAHLDKKTFYLRPDEKEGWQSPRLHAEYLHLNVQALAAASRAVELTYEPKARATAIDLIGRQRMEAHRISGATAGMTPTDLQAMLENEGLDGLEGLQQEALSRIQSLLDRSLASIAAIGDTAKNVTASDRVADRLTFGSDNTKRAIMGATQKFRQALAQGGQPARPAWDRWVREEQLRFLANPELASAVMQAPMGVVRGSPPRRSRQGSAASTDSAGSTASTNSATSSVEATPPPVPPRT